MEAEEAEAVEEVIGVAVVEEDGDGREEGGGVMGLVLCRLTAMTSTLRLICEGTVR